MDGRGGCCIARYAGGAYDMSKVDRIMLRFRPIAPKPASKGAGSGGSSPEISEVSLSPRSGRGKRRQSASNNNSTSKRCSNGNNNRKRKASSDEKADAVVTLPLLPEAPDRKDTPASASPGVARSASRWLSFGNNVKERGHLVKPNCFSFTPPDRTVGVKRVVESCVTVVCVTDTWCELDGSSLGRTDEERGINLGKDTCPGFISDGFGRVTWTNEAYRKMAVGEGEDDAATEVVVWVVMKENKVPVTLTLAGHAAFTCRVRVQNYNSNSNDNISSGGCKEKGSITVPCDVWRMDGGGFAWRLDVKAALSLGR